MSAQPAHNSCAAPPAYRFPSLGAQWGENSPPRSQSPCDTVPKHRNSENRGKERSFDNTLVADRHTFPTSLPGKSCGYSPRWRPTHFRHAPSTSRDAQRTPPTAARSSPPTGPCRPAQGGRSWRDQSHGKLPTIACSNSWVPRWPNARRPPHGRRRWVSTHHNNAPHGGVRESLVSSS